MQVNLAPRPPQYTRTFANSKIRVEKLQITNHSIQESELINFSFVPCFIYTTVRQTRNASPKENPFPASIKQWQMEKLTIISTLLLSVSHWFFKLHCSNCSYLHNVNIGQNADFKQASFKHPTGKLII